MRVAPPSTRGSDARCREPFTTAMRGSSRPCMRWDPMGMRWRAGRRRSPRGVMIHHYKVDEKGAIRWINLIVATGHNNYFIDGNRVERHAQPRFGGGARLKRRPRPGLAAPQSSATAFPARRRRRRALRRQATGARRPNHRFDPENLAWSPQLYGRAPAARRAAGKALRAMRKLGRAPQPQKSGRIQL
jgi:hypothetical protein